MDSNRVNLPPIELDDGCGVISADVDYPGRMTHDDVAAVNLRAALPGLLRQRDAEERQGERDVVLPEDLARRAAEKAAKMAGIDPGLPVVLVEEIYDASGTIEQRLAEISENLPNRPVVIPVQFGRPIYQHHRDGSIVMNITGRPRKYGGRKITYRRERVEDFLELVRAGHTIDKAARKCCLPIQDVYSWTNIVPEFDALLIDARRRGAHALLDEIADIADEVADAPDRAQVDAAKLRVQTRQWLAERLLPNLYSPKQQVETSQNVTFNIGIVRAPPQKLEECTEGQLVTSNPKLTSG